MAETIRLARVLLKCGLGHDKENGKNFGGIAINGVLIICLLPIVYYVFQGGTWAYTMLGSFDPSGLTIQMVLFLAAIIIFATGIVSTMSSLYLSSNTENLLVLPLTPTQIAGAKVIVAAAYEYYISVAILVPFLLGYGTSMNAGAMFYVGMVVAVITLPIVPIVYGAVISIVIMRFFNFLKNREHTKTVSVVGLFILYLIIDVIQSIIGGMQSNTAESIMTHLEKEIQHIATIFPSIPFLTKTMVQGDVIALIIAVLIAVVGIAIFMVAAKTMYFQGVIGAHDKSGKAKKLTDEDITKELHGNSVMKSYMKKELRLILRTPGFYMNCLFLTLLWPIILLVPMMFSPTKRNQLAILEHWVTNGSNQTFLLFVIFMIVFGVTAFVVGLNSIANSSISREGANFFVMKQLPISYKTQIRAKRNVAMIICWIGSGLYLFLAELVLYICGKFPWWGILFSIVLNLFLVWGFVNLQMILGIMKPNLAWESETNAMNGKQNFLLVLLGCVVDGILIVVFGDMAHSKSISFSTIIIVSFVVAICIAIITEIILINYGSYKLDKM